MKTYKAVNISQEEIDAAIAIIKKETRYCLTREVKLVEKLLTHLNDLSYFKDITVGLTATGDDEAQEPFEIKYFEIE